MSFCKETEPRQRSRDLCSASRGIGAYGSGSRESCRRSTNSREPNSSQVCQCRQRNHYMPFLRRADE